MANIITQGIGFNVTHAEDAHKEGHLKLEVVFDKNPTQTYNYVRSYKVDRYGNKVVQIDGCRVVLVKDYLNNTYKADSYTRLHDTEGKKKFATKAKGKEQIIPEVDPPLPTIESIVKEIEEEVKVEYDPDGNVKHEKYNDIRTCLECNLPIYLAGPAGSGKNFTVEQIAKELGWNFYFSNSVQQEYKITGFIDAGGDYHETEFYKACTDENDCVFFLDEMDASIPEVLVLLNAAIANGYFEFPTGRVDLDHVHFVAAGNTVGSGADEMYSGRMVLDQATLDRFVIIDFDYSEGIELAITNNNKVLVDFVHQLRKEATSKGIRATFSYRCLTMVTKLEGAGMKLDKILMMAVFKGMDKDTIKTFSTWNFKESTYLSAMKTLQAA